MAQHDADPVRSDLDPAFRPELVGVELLQEAVRPGGQAWVTFRFRNSGTAAARDNYRVFVHLEHPEPSCENIRFQFDHMPTVPTSRWEPRREIADGPHPIPVPADATRAPHHLHVGLFAAEGDGRRVLDVYWDTPIVVSDSAEPVEIPRPEPLPEADLRARRRRAAELVSEGLVIDRPEFRLTIDPAAGAFGLLDKRSSVAWTSHPDTDRLADVELRGPDGVRNVPLRAPAEVRESDAGFVLRFRLPVGEGGARLAVDLAFGAEAEPRSGLRVACRRSDDAVAGWTIRSVTLFEGAFGVTDADEGYCVLPFRLGEMLPATGLPQVRRFATHSQTSLAMCGAVKQGSALLVAWKSPDVRLDVATSWPDHPAIPGRVMNSLSFVLSQEAQEVTLYPLGTGGYVEIGKAYRAVARANGWLKTWADKRQRFPQVDRMFGAADFKPFVLSRTIPGSRFNTTGKDQVSLMYTFEEAALNAEHLARDLGIDQAMYVLAGWIHRGYDNQHPDILPAAPECGGDAGLAECARRVRDAGFLFGLHDNYQDMYRDASSWDESCLNKLPNGISKKGGNWAGGQAWQVCAVKQVELARRPQNLPAVRDLCKPTIYFIDTTFAWGLVTCDDPAHPMTRADDMHWKSELCDTAKEHFGLFGSEEGREWAVAHADYFEGLFSHKVGHPRFARSSGGVVIPLYELVYGDCINLYTHQSDRARPGRPSYILDCILYAENPLYAFGTHVYFRGKEAAPATIGPSIAEFRQVAPRKISFRYSWRVTAGVDRDLACFVHFTHPDGDKERERIAFQDDHSPDPVSSSWRAGQTVLESVRTLEVPAQFSGKIDWYVGLIDGGSRVRLDGREIGNRRYLVGVLHVEGDDVSFDASASAHSGPVFSRGDQGWAADLCETDRFIKNTYEVVSWVNRLTAETPMTEHEFVTPDRTVERSAFGDLRVWVNYGEEPYVVQAGDETIAALGSGDVELPRYGFLVASPDFCAFHATTFGGTTYTTPALFTARALDGRPLWESGEVRVFHGFGEPELRLAGRAFRVEREEEVSAR